MKTVSADVYISALFDLYNAELGNIYEKSGNFTRDIIDLRRRLDARARLHTGYGMVFPYNSSVDDD